MTNAKMNDIVNHPPHYKAANGVEAIDVIEGFTDPIAWNNGNVIKYICRWQRKNGLEDLKKAQFYLNRLIDLVERGNDDVQDSKPCKFDNVIFDSEGDAAYALCQLRYLIHEYDVATIYDLYSAAGFHHEPDDRLRLYGWTNLDEVYIKKDKDGYHLAGFSSPRYVGAIHISYQKM